jgi:hypothetical protein
MVRTWPNELPGIPAGIREKDPDYQSPGTGSQGYQTPNKKVGAFTNDTSLLRLAVSILIDINEEWIMGNRYLSVMSEMISLDTGVADFTAL